MSYATSKHRGVGTGVAEQVARYGRPLPGGRRYRTPGHEIGSTGVQPPRVNA